MTTYGPEVMTTFTLRVPDRLIERVRKQAVSNRRSLNGEITVLLEQAVPEKGKAEGHAA
jgi:hypothetical protein